MSSGTLPENQVQAMFDRIARVYDRMNSVMTAGLDQRWRRRAADLAACGRGRPRRSTWPPAPATWPSSSASRGAEVTGLDFSEEMLSLARDKEPAIDWRSGNALALPFADDEFAAATVGFGARNFDDLSRGLEEMVRVVRPGGRVVVLEITTPQRPPLSWFFGLWFDRIVPACWAAWPATPTPTTTCPTRSAASPAPRAWPPTWTPPA